MIKIELKEKLRNQKNLKQNNSIIKSKEPQMYHTEITTKYTFPTKGSSHELCEKVLEYIKKNTNGYSGFVSCDGNGIMVTSLNNTLPIEVLDDVHNYIPIWTNEIKTKLFNAYLENL